MPALLRTRSLDLVAANRPGELLYAPVLEWGGTRRTVNLLEFAFLGEEAAHGFWPNWRDVAMRSVTELRTAVDASPDDPKLLGLVGVLSARSRAFCRMWISQELPGRTTRGEETVFNPLIGTVTFPFRILHEDDDAHVVVYAPRPGSAAHAAMRILEARASFR